MNDISLVTVDCCGSIPVFKKNRAGTVYAIVNPDLIICTAIVFYLSFYISLLWQMWKDFFVWYKCIHVGILYNTVTYCILALANTWTFLKHFHWIIYSVVPQHWFFPVHLLVLQSIHIKPQNEGKIFKAKKWHSKCIQTYLHVW